MNRGMLLLAVVLLLGCSTTTAPFPPYSRYSLAAVDGKPLPIEYGSDGSKLVANTLDFGGAILPGGDAELHGTVRYVLDVQRPDQSVDHSETSLNYVIQGDVLRVDLCPPGALCITTTELVGSISGDRAELVLTHEVAAKPLSQYRFVATLPD